jgi:hypothetical protein
MLYLNIQDRKSPKGMFIGKDSRSTMLQIDTDFAKVKHYGVDAPLQRIEVRSYFMFSILWTYWWRCTVSIILTLTFHKLLGQCHEWVVYILATMKYPVNWTANHYQKWKFSGFNLNSGTLAWKYITSQGFSGFFISIHVHLCTLISQTW